MLSLLGIASLTYVAVFGVLGFRVNLGSEQRQMVNLGHLDIMVLTEFDPVRDKKRAPLTVTFCKNWTGWRVKYRNSMDQRCPIIYLIRPLY